MVTKLIVSDVDSTLLEDGQGTPGLEKLKQILYEESERVNLVYATGRTFESTWELVEAGVLPRPAGIAPLVGTELWLPPWDKPAAEYWSQIAPGWDLGKIAEIAESFGDQMQLQPHCFQGRFKRSYFVEDPSLVANIERFLSCAGSEARVIYSGNRFLDIVPARAGKKSAVGFCRRLWQIAPQNVLTCGDSGNDLDMLSDPHTLGVIVGNAEKTLLESCKLKSVHKARSPFAAGVLEGAEAFSFWQAS